jgi:predicted Zn-dependent protease
MKKLGNYLSIIILLGLIGTSAYFIYQKTRSPCDRQLEYSIGRFDTQFGISQSDFKSYITDAGSVWEKVLGKKEFIYNPNASFKINLVYDERQLATVQKQKTEFGLSAAEDVFKKLDTDFEAFKSQYDQRVASYESDLASLKKRQSDYEAEVAKFNNMKRLSRDQFQSLETERQYINSEVQRLNSEASSINTLTGQMNNLLEKRNAGAATYNKIAAEYNKKYNGGLEFNQAEYTGSAINVYQFGNKKDLILAITHELGHAIGMGHVDNPKSIMYYITGINAETNPAPTAEDLAELNKVCKQ